MPTYPPFSGAWSAYRNSSEYAYALDAGASSLSLTYASVAPSSTANDRYNDPTVAAISALSLLDVDATATWKWQDTGDALSFDAQRGFGIAARLPGSSLPGYSVSARASTGDVTLLAVGAGDFDEGDFDDNVIAEATKTFGGFAEDTAYSLRVSVVETAVGESRIRARVWLTSGAEPLAWDLDATVDNSTGSPEQQARHVGTAGAVGVFNAGDGSVTTGGTFLDNARGRTYVLESFVLRSTAALASDRLRSNISETTGSLLEAVDARAVDASVSEAYTYAQELAGTSLRTFREVLRERDSATADFAYYPQPRQNIVMENQYTGISVLSRLARYYPPRIFDDVVNLDIAVIPAATATDIIDYVLTQWAADNDWLTFETVPDLRVPMPGLVPSDYGVGTGQVYAATVTIRQDGTNRQDALSILRDLLSPFPGTVVRQNSSGKLEIVPASGPDADETPHVTLTTDDLYSVTIGKPNPFDVINRCTVTSSGGLVQDEDVAVMQPAWFQVGSLYQFGRSNWYTPPVDRLNLQPFDDPTDTTLQEGLTISSNFNLQKPVLWPISGDAIPAGDGISLVDTLAAEQVTIAWARYFNDSLVSSGTNGLTITTEVIPFSGAWVDALSVSFSTGGETVFANIRMRWNEAQQGIEIGLGTAKLETDCFTGCNGVIIEFALNDASVGYTEGTSVSGTFGFVGDDDTVLPADSASGDAVLDSQTALGIVERTINIKGYAFDATTLSQIARGYVIQNITPKVVRELDVSALSGYRVVFDDIGRMIELPSGDVGFLTGVSYTDDFVSKVVRKTATVEVRDLAAPGAIDTTTAYLLVDDGSYWTSDDGTPSEVF